MVAATLNFLDSHISLEKQVCVLGACSYIAGAVVKSSVCGIICAAAVIIAYGCLYNAYVIKPSQRAAAQKIQSLEDNLRNTESERARLEQTLNQTTSSLKKVEDRILDLVDRTNERTRQIRDDASMIASYVTHKAGIEKKNYDAYIERQKEDEKIVKIALPIILPILACLGYLFIKYV